VKSHRSKNGDSGFYNLPELFKSGRLFFAAFPEKEVNFHPKGPALLQREATFLLKEELMPP